MYLENIAVDAADPVALGTFWEALLGGRRLGASEHLFETRLDLPGGQYLDLCLGRVPEPVAPSPRLHLDLRGGSDQGEMVGRALALGAHPLDIGQGDVPWVVLADPEGNPFCVMEARDAYRETGPVAALPLHCADPAREARLWSYLTGWVPEEDPPAVVLRHRSGTGPLLELFPEPAAKIPGAKNRVHLDVRLEDGDDVEAVLARVRELGGREVEPGWGELPWRVLQDGSGNELCLLPARRG